MMQQPDPKCHDEFPTGGSNHPRRRHDVFISFKGSDVRHTFAAQLRTALRREGVTSFADDDSYDLPRGEILVEAIPRAIERSRFSVVVLSRNYASSEWCLDELVTIMMCCCSSTSVGSRARHVAIPIFYCLSPEEVAAGGCYKEDLDRHKSRYTYERVDGWLRALAWIAGISGWVVPAAAGQLEARLVKKIARAMGREVKKVPVAASDIERNNMMNHRINVTVWGSNDANRRIHVMTCRRHVFIDDDLSEQYLTECNARPHHRLHLWAQVKMLLSTLWLQRQGCRSLGFEADCS